MTAFVTSSVMVVLAVSISCAAPAPKRQAVTDGAIASPSDGGHGLAYKEYTLDGAAPDALLIALHYSSSTPEFWDELVKDWGAPVRVVLPRGPRPHREGFTWFPAEHEKQDAAGKLADVERMAARIAELITQIRRAHPEIHRVAVTGFSYGGDLAWLLAIRHPDLVNVAVPMGSRLLGDPAQPLPASTRVLVLHGEVDAIIDAHQTSERVKGLQSRAVPIEARIYPGLGHDMSPQLIEDWRTFLREALRDGAIP